MTPEPLAYTVSEAAKALRVSRYTVYRLIESKALTPVPNLSPTRIAVQEVQRFANSTANADTAA